MRTVNKVILIWNVTKDPLVKTTESGKKVALFTIATNRYFKSPEWENKSEAEFNNCVVWGNLAERVEKFLSKGKLVYVEWRLKTRMIDKDDGSKIYKTEVVLSNLIFLNKKSDFDSIEENAISDDDFLEDDKF